MTPENVNCIPDDFSASLFYSRTPDKIDYHLCKLIRFCKANNYGFIQLALLDYNSGSIRYLLSDFKSYICFESITLPRNNYNLGISEMIESEKKFQKTPLLEWCAEYCIVSLVMFLEAGVRVGGIEEAFQILAKEKIYTYLTGIAIRKNASNGCWCELHITAMLLEGYETHRKV